MTQSNWITIINEVNKELLINLNLVNSIYINDNKKQIMLYQNEPWIVYWQFDNEEDCEREFNHLKTKLRGY
jgi:hypothetical protein